MTYYDIEVTRWSEVDLEEGSQRANRRGLDGAAARDTLEREGSKRIVDMRIRLTTVHYEALPLEWALTPDFLIRVLRDGFVHSAGLNDHDCAALIHRYPQVDWGDETEQRFTLNFHDIGFAFNLAGLRSSEDPNSVVGEVADVDILIPAAIVEGLQGRRWRAASYVSAEDALVHRSPSISRPSSLQHLGTIAPFEDRGEIYVAMADQGRRLIVWNYRGAFRSYSLPDMRCLASEPALSEMPYTLAVDHETGTLLCARDGADHLERRSLDGELIKRIPLADKAPGMIWSLNGGRIIGVTLRNEDLGETVDRICLVSIQDGRTITEIATHANDFLELSLCPSGGLGASHDGQLLKVWQSDGHALWSKQIDICNLAFLDDTTLLTYHSDGAAVIWDARDGREIKRSVLRQPKLCYLAAAPSGDWVVLSWDALRADIAFCQLHRGEQHDMVEAVRRIQAPDMRSDYGVVNSFAFSRDGKRLALGASNNRVHVYEQQRHETRGTTEVAPPTTPTETSAR